MFSYSLAWLLAISWTATVYAFPWRRRSTDVTYGTIGDSWASGVTYGLFGYTDYDDNSPGCMRVKHAYGAQLSDSLKSQGHSTDFTFAACSGAHLIDMAGRLEAPQANQLPANTQFVTLQAGGNDAGFYEVASDCFFHNEDQSYGPDYPDPSGQCAISLNNTRNFIMADAPLDGTRQWTADAIRDVFTKPAAQTPGFKLYVLGYAHLWNVDPGDSDWCNQESFSVSFNEFTSGTRVKLSNALRTEINDLTTAMNNQIQTAVRDFNSPMVEYVSITEGFDGHRFCERGHTLRDQYFGGKVWFHNASPDGLFPTWAPISQLPSYWTRQKQANEEWKQVVDVQNVYAPNLAQYNWTSLLETQDGVHAQSPHQGWSPGIALRPFHPKS